MNNIVERPTLDEERQDRRERWKAEQEKVGKDLTLGDSKGPLTARLSGKKYAKTHAERSKQSSKEFGTFSDIETS